MAAQLRLPSEFEAFARANPAMPMVAATWLVQQRLKRRGPVPMICWPTRRSVETARQINDLAATAHILGVPLLREGRNPSAYLR